MKRLSRSSAIPALVLLAGMLGLFASALAQQPWDVPARHARKKNPVAGNAAATTRGKAVFAEQCASCHGEKGHGDGQAAKLLKLTLPNFADPAVAQQSDGALFYKVTTGRNKMPAFEKLLSEQQRWEIVNYLRTFASAAPKSTGWDAPAREARRKNPTPADAASIARGKSVFAEQCASCHGDAGHGDGSAAKLLKLTLPNFASPAFTPQSDGSIFFKVTKGRNKMPAFEKLISPEQRWDVINYLRTFAGTPKPRSPLARPAFSAPAAHRQALSAVLHAYTEVSAALAASDLAAAKTALRKLDATATAMAKLAQDAFTGGALKAWQGSLKYIGSAVAGLKAAADLTAFRKAFKRLSDVLYWVHGKFGHAESGPIYVMLSDNAFGTGKKAGWVQTTAAVKNPYLGTAGQAAGRVLKRIAATK